MKLKETLALLDDLISFPTISSDSKLQMIALLAERLEAAGARVDILKNKTGAKANLFAALGIIAAAATMAPEFAARIKDCPVHFAFTYDEVVGCFGVWWFEATLFLFLLYFLFLFPIFI